MHLLFLLLFSVNFLHSAGLAYLSLCSFSFNPNYQPKKEKDIENLLVDVVLSCNQGSKNIKNVFCLIKKEFEKNPSQSIKKKILKAFIEKKLYEKDKTVLQQIIFKIIKTKSPQFEGMKSLFYFLFDIKKNAKIEEGFNQIYEIAETESD